MPVEIIRVLVLAVVVWTVYAIVQLIMGRSPI